eukprot:TRINITY_DN29266_c1_g1_i4.p2 TRINITY_DN29266_c1_g1~~TRINITY_DN29266_c1_g1_i4.p2  ORF type:complete len:182 (-),score=32.08 TRINITY_DN29266_c1_g1_i4:355-900(-)
METFAQVVAQNQAFSLEQGDQNKIFQLYDSLQNKSNVFQYPNFLQPVTVFDDQSVGIEIIQEIDFNLSAGDIEEEVKQKVDKEKNSIQKALASLDDHLDEIEKRGPGNAGILYNFTSSSAGQATVKGLQAATEVTIGLGKQAIKLAGPLSKAVLTEGVKLAGKAIAVAEKSEKNQNSDKQK